MSVQISDSARLKLITYYNYIEAWVICVKNRYGSGDDGINTFVQEIKSLKIVKDIPGGASISPALVNPYNRGRWTLLLMKNLPIDNYPKLTLYANLWLPVQSYFAINAIGKATMIALNMNPPRGHNPFLRTFWELVHRYLPYPFCGLCIGGPEERDFSFSQLNTSASKVIQQSNIATPNLGNADNLIGKSLSTTRWNRIKILLRERRKKDRKPDKKWRRLTSQERRECCNKEHPTSICDFIYRMRIRSNYENPDMYIFALNNPQDAANHFRNLLYLTEIFVAGLDTLIERRIGCTEMAKLKSRFE